MSKMKQVTEMGRNIEKSSFQIIDEEAGTHNFSEDEWEVVRRMIHTTGDFEFKELTKISPDAIDSAVEAIKSECNIISDVNMIITGINKKRMSVFNNNAYCYISDEDVIARALDKGNTRAIESVYKAIELDKLNGSIICVGNAPTFLLEVIELIKQKKIRPALIIGIPVGFVSAVESKDDVIALYSNEKIPYIVSTGRKGGSTLVVAAIHALLTITEKRCRS